MTALISISSALFSVVVSVSPACSRFPSFTELYRERIFQPLGLKHTAYDPEGPIAGPHANLDDVGEARGPDSTLPLPRATKRSASPNVQLAT